MKNNPITSDQAAQLVLKNTSIVDFNTSSTLDLQRYLTELRYLYDSKHINKKKYKKEKINALELYLSNLKKKHNLILT